MCYTENRNLSKGAGDNLKKIVSMLLLMALLASVLLLPVCGAIKPADPDAAAAREVIAEYLGKDTPGAALVLVRKGKETVKEGFGYASINDKANNILVHPNTVFEIGEISSVFVALAAYRLSQEGWLDLSKDVTDYLPDHVVSQLGLRYHTTVLDLLLGCCGFEGRTFDLLFDDDSHRFDSLEAALLSEVPKQVYMPGERYTKSPFGMALAAYVVECAAGQSYEEYVKARILDPLGMTDTVLNPNRHVWPEYFAVGHKVTAEGQFATAANSGRSYAGFYPVSGALSSAADMAKLVEFMLNGNAAVLDDAVRAEWLSEFYQSGVFTLSAPGMEARGNVGAQAAVIELDDQIGLCLHIGLCRRGLYTLHNGFYAQHQFLGGEGLDNVVVNSHLKAIDAVVFLAASRKHNYRSIGGLANFSASRKSVKLGHHNIHNNNIKFFKSCESYRLHTVACLGYGVAFKFRIFFDYRANSRLVVNYKYVVHIKILL